MSSLADRLRIAGKGRHSDVMPSIQVNTGSQGASCDLMQQGGRAIVA
jgi:hypothetical protein